MMGIGLMVGALTLTSAVEDPMAIEAALKRTAPTLPDKKPRSIGAKESTHRAVVEDSELGDIEVKLKLASRGARNFNNEPRLDLAAYEVQKLFLDPEEFVVPPTALSAMSVEDARRFTPRSRATFSSSKSVVFIVQVWLQNVDRPAELPDPDNALSDAQALALARFNLFTHLIQHGDGNRGNFLVSKESSAPRVFSVDNDISFGRSADQRGPNWQNLRVHILPGASVERLRRLDSADLHRRLGVLVEFKVVDGLMIPAEPGPNMAPKRGIRSRGERIQFGLTRREIDQLVERIDRLLERVDRGEFELR